MTRGLRYIVPVDELARALGLPDGVTIVGVTDEDTVLTGMISLLLTGESLPVIANGARPINQFMRRGTTATDAYREQVRIILGVPASDEGATPADEHRSIVLDDVIPEIPPREIMNDGLDRSVPTDEPVRVVDSEPDAVPNDPATIVRVAANIYAQRAQTEADADHARRMRLIRGATEHREDPTEEPSQSQLRNLYEQYLERVFEGIKNLPTFPGIRQLADALHLTSDQIRIRGVTSWLSYTLEHIRPTWEQYRRDQQDIVLGVSPYRRRHATTPPLPETMFVPALYDVQRYAPGIPLNAEYFVNAGDFSSPELRSVTAFLVRRNRDATFTIETLLHCDSPVPDLNAMNRLGAHPEVAASVQCRWCAEIVAYDGRSRICRNCGGLL